MIQRTLLLCKVKVKCITLASIVDTPLAKLKRRVYNTGDSQVVTHQGTNPARHCLTSVIR